MEKQPSFQSQLEESQVEFRKQFDPTSPSYHAGSQQPVPIQKQKIPESMPTMYPEGYNPNELQQTIDYGEKYKQIQKDRNVYQNLKKSLAKLCPIVESFLRHEEAFKQKGDPKNQKHLKTYQENVQKETVALQLCQSELALFLPQLQAIDFEAKEQAKELAAIIHESSKKYDSKESLTDFNFKAKKLSAKIFANAQKCLQLLKDIKKQYANNSKKTESTEKKENV